MINTEKRELWIDTAKGIAMISVILGHMGNLSIGTMDFKFVYTYHLPVFFILSGYTLKKKKLDAQWVNQKFLRLMTPYFLTCAAILVMDILNSVLRNHENSILTITQIVHRDLLRSFFASGSIKIFGEIELGSRIGAIWFLPAMFFAVLLAQYILNHVNRLLSQYLLAGCLFLLGNITAQFIWYPFSIQAGMSAVILILFGFHCRQYGLLEKLRWKHYLAFFVVLCVAVYTDETGIYMVTNHYPDWLGTLLIMVSCSLFIIGLARKMHRDFMFRFIGRNSMYYLCAHLFALETWGGIWRLRCSNNLEFHWKTLAYIFVPCHIFYNSYGALFTPPKSQKTAGDFILYKYLLTA